MLPVAPPGSACTGGGVGMGYSQHSGVVIVCDGSEAAGKRIARVLWNDPALRRDGRADRRPEDAAPTKNAGHPLPRCCRADAPPAGSAADAGPVGAGRVAGAGGTSAFPPDCAAADARCRLAREAPAAYRGEHPGDASERAIPLATSGGSSTGRRWPASTRCARFRGGAGSGWLYLQYELHARAKLLQAQRRVPYPQAWRSAFRDRFGTLDDATALQAEFAFGGNLVRMRADFDAARAARGARNNAAGGCAGADPQVPGAGRLLSFVPLFVAALAEDDARRCAIDRDALVRTPDGASISTLVVRPAGAQPLPTRGLHRLRQRRLGLGQRQRWPRAVTSAWSPIRAARDAAPTPSFPSGATATTPRR